jgi:hypothetical protein
MAKKSHNGDASIKRNRKKSSLNPTSRTSKPAANGNNKSSKWQRRDKKFVAPDEQDIDIKQHMRRNRRRLRRQQRQFIAAVEQQRPNINPDRLLLDFENIAQRSTGRMVKLAMRSLALISAASYASEELNNRLNADDLNFRMDEVNTMARKLVRLHTLRLMLRVFRLPKDINQQIVNLQIAKDFGAVPGNPPPRMIAQPPIAATDSVRKHEQITRPNPFRPQEKRPAQKPSHW